MDRPKDIPSPKEIKDALAQAPDSDLLNEVLRRGLIVKGRQWSAPGPLDETMGDETMADGTMKYWETLRERELQERRRGSQWRMETGDIDEAIASLMAGAARRQEYVGELFDLLRRKRLEKMRGLSIRRADTAPEFADLGVRTTKAIFDHLVIARRAALDAGACDIESLWAYFMDDAGYRFASGMVKGDITMPPDLWASFIFQTVQGAAMSFLDIVEEDAEGPASEGNESGDKNPDFVK
jgi:hypothetical protein